MKELMEAIRVTVSIGKNMRRKVAENISHFEITQISVAPLGDKIPLNILGYYAVQLAMLNQLHTGGLITDREHISIKRALKS